MRRADQLAPHVLRALLWRGTALWRRLAIRTSSSDDGLTVEIEDNGPGIPPDLACRLFDSFVTTKPNGLGIGLSICRSIIEAHGGRMPVSNGEQGAHFAFTLPAAFT